MPIIMTSNIGSEYLLDGVTSGGEIKPDARLGLGPVGGDDLGCGPVVVACDEQVLADELVFEGGH